MQSFLSFSRARVCLAACVLLLAVYTEAYRLGEAPSSASQRPPSPATAEFTHSNRATSAYYRPAAKKVVAIGDVHGDMMAFAKSLMLVGAIDESLHWVGGEMVVVQVGDQVDRGTDERVLLELIQRLEREAAAAGGAMLSLLGNHEFLNVFGVFNYVSAPEGFTDFDIFQKDLPSSTPGVVSPSGRAAAFAPGGVVAKMLADRYISLVVGDTLFVHAGLLKKHVELGPAYINAVASEFLRGNLALRDEASQLLMSEDSPVWTRRYGSVVSAEDCAELADVLAAVGAKRMVVGHTIQASGISNTCNGALWRVDTGLAEFYQTPGQAVVQVLDIETDRVTVVDDRAMKSM